MKKLLKDSHSGKVGSAGLLAALTLVAMQHSASAVPAAVSYDEILSPSGVNPAFLAGNVSMEVVGGKLCIYLQNTSGNAAGSGAGVLLTGIGLNLPTGVSIASGQASIGTGSTGVGFGGTDISKEWGYDNGPLQSGAMKSAANAVNTAVSSMVSQTTDQFAKGSIDNSGNLAGPDFGLVSAAELDPLGGGVEAIKDSIKITINLNNKSGFDLGGLVSFIDANPIVLTFGSPSGAVPDASTAALLLGVAMMGLEGLRRRILKN